MPVFWHGFSSLSTWVIIFYVFFYEHILRIVLKVFSAYFYSFY